MSQPWPHLRAGARCAGFRDSGLRGEARQLVGRMWAGLLSPEREASQGGGKKGGAAGEEEEEGKKEREGGKEKEGVDAGRQKRKVGGKERGS